jgi:hypothetical protein
VESTKETMNGKVIIQNVSYDMKLNETSTLKALRNDCVNNTSDEFDVLYLHSKGVTHYDNPVPVYCMGDGDCILNNSSHQLTKGGPKRIHDPHIIKMTSYVTIRTWVDYLLYFNVSHWQECVNELQQGHDACGVNLKGGYDNHKDNYHFSGNFWWAKSEYIKKLYSSIWSTMLGKNIFMSPDEKKGMEEENDLNRKDASEEFWIGAPLLKKGETVSFSCIWHSGINFDFYINPYPHSEYENRGFMKTYAKINDIQSLTLIREPLVVRKIS